MKALLIDFGSTYTKVTLVNLDPPGLIATAQAPTTVATDLVEGLQQALAGLTPDQLDGVGLTRACSSAAGGLKIVAIGLVPELTVKAASEAAMGAGGRVLAAYAHTLTDQELQEISVIQPDLILLAGGTDGGERRTILENAARLADSSIETPVVIAGNKAAADEAAALLQGRVRRVLVTGNVMPEVNQLDVEPARRTIRDLYLQEIPKAKGLDHIQKRFGLAMPTPLAVMKAGELLQRILNQDVVVVDIGGATTDVHSFAAGRPTRAGCIYRGLPEPFAKRTVEGDLGVRVSALSLLNAIGAERLMAYPALSDPALVGYGLPDIRDYAAKVFRRKDSLPEDRLEQAYDRAMAIACIREALRRHAGLLTEAYTPDGRLWIQQGKDLTGVGCLVGTGGVLVHAGDPGPLLADGLDQEDPLRLTPRLPQLQLDRNYMLSAIGLLCEIEPEAARVLLEQDLAMLGETSFGEGCHVVEE